MLSPYSKESEQVRARKYERKEEIRQTLKDRVIRILTKDQGYIKQGYLVQSSGGSSLKTLLFVLRREEAAVVLHCLRVKNKKYQLKGKIPLKSVGVCPIQPSKKMGSKAAAYYWLQLNTTVYGSHQKLKTKLVYLGTETEKERELWVSALLSCEASPSSSPAPTSPSRANAGSPIQPPSPFLGDIDVDDDDEDDYDIFEEDEDELRASTEDQSNLFRFASDPGRRIPLVTQEDAPQQQQQQKRKSVSPAAAHPVDPFLGNLIPVDSKTERVLANDGATLKQGILSYGNKSKSKSMVAILRKEKIVCILSLLKARSDGRYQVDVRIPLRSQSVSEVNIEKGKFGKRGNELYWMELHTTEFVKEGVLGLRDYFLAGRTDTERKEWVNAIGACDVDVQNAGRVTSVEISRLADRSSDERSPPFSLPGANRGEEVSKLAEKSEDDDEESRIEIDLSDCEREAPPPSSSSSTAPFVVSETGDVRVNRKKKPALQASSAADLQMKGEALYDFTAAEGMNDELSLRVGDRVVITHFASDQEWWQGVNERTRTVGLFPRTFVKFG